MSKLIIGLTGGIGSGKSTVARLFEKLGACVIDADKIAHKIVSPPSKYLDKIAKKFGRSILDRNAALNRTRLRQLIFNDPQAKTWLESLLHPPIYKALFSQAKQAKSAYSLLVIPLLFETLPNPKNFLDRIAVVDTSRKHQMERIQERNHLTKNEIDSIIKSQIGRKDRLAKADDIIKNISTLKALEQQVKKLHEKYQSESRS